jgi:hypothetical protein
MPGQPPGMTRSERDFRRRGLFFRRWRTGRRTRFGNRRRCSLWLRYRNSCGSGCCRSLGCRWRRRTGRGGWRLSFASGLAVRPGRLLRLALLVCRTTSDWRRRPLHRSLPRWSRDRGTAATAHKKIRQHGGVLNTGRIVLTQEAGQFALPTAFGQSGRALVADRTSSLKQFRRRFAFVEVDGFGLVTCWRQRRALLGARGGPAWLGVRLKCQQHCQCANRDPPAPIQQIRAPAAAAFAAALPRPRVMNAKREFRPLTWRMWPIFEPCCQSGNSEIHRTTSLIVLVERRSEPDQTGITAFLVCAQSGIRKRRRRSGMRISVSEHQRCGCYHRIAAAARLWSN